MLWLVCGVTIGPFLESRLTNRFFDPKERYRFVVNIVMALLFVVYYPVAVGAFVVVAKMIKEYGSCTVVAELGT